MTDYNEKVDELISRMAKAENTLAGSLHWLDLLENKVNRLKEQILVLEETKSAGTITRDIGSMSTKDVVKELIKRDSVFKITDHVETTREYRTLMQQKNIKYGKIWKKYHTGYIADLHTIDGEQVAMIELADGNLIDVACKYLKLRECTCGECDLCRKQMSKNETMALNEQYMTKDENENRRIVGVVY